MIVGVIQASSQTNKNNILFDAVKEYATGHEVINLGCFPDDIIKYSYIEISIEIGILLASKAVDFVVTGCSSGQGMLMYGKEASNRKQEIDRQHYTIPNQRPKDKHCGKI